MSKQDDDFLRASKALDAGNEKQALVLCGRAAALGDASSQHNLGYCFDKGIGTRRNVKKALYWYKRAARRGETASLTNIGKLYQEQGNARRSSFWLKKAIRTGDGDAALDLAKTYIASGGRQSRRAAVVLLKRCLSSRNVTRSSIEAAKALFEDVKRRLREL